MAVDRELLAQALRTPPSQDVTESPIVRTVVLSDPENARDLVPELQYDGTLEAENARRILCQFDAPAVPHILAALADQPARARKHGIEVAWVLLSEEPRLTVEDTLRDAAADLDALLRDRSALPDDMPEHIERDFRGRICDLAYLVVVQLMDKKTDQSLFRSLDDSGRDQAVGRLRARLGGIA